MGVSKIVAKKRGTGGSIRSCVDSRFSEPVLVGVRVRLAKVPSRSSHVLLLLDELVPRFYTNSTFRKELLLFEGSLFPLTHVILSIFLLFVCIGALLLGFVFFYT